MKKLLALCICLHLFSGLSQAQIIGSDTVCAGYIYNYSIVVPGALSYVWSVPAGWYGLSGQGSSQISITCNVNAGSVCVESFDGNSVSLGTQCLMTNFGGSGGSYHLEPSGINDVCDGMSSVLTIPQLVYDGPGGGGCLPGCGNGTPHPNIVWGIYTGVIFQGLVGDSMLLGIYNTYRVVNVDTTNGSNFPQAIEIIGCGGSVTGNFGFATLGFHPGAHITPFNYCIGDTVWIHGYVAPIYCGSGYQVWSQFSNLIPLTSIFDPDSIQVIVTGAMISFMHSSCFQIQSGMLAGTACWDIYPHYWTVPSCAVDASFSVDNSTICEDNCLSFINSSTHATNYQWIFPGAIPSTSTDTNPTGICYPDTGFFDVTLIGSNPDSTDTLFLPGYIHVVSAPQADFIPVANSICSDDCILFSNYSSNGTSYQWSFPGANPSSSTDLLPVPVCYPNAGTFDVTLVSLNAGCSDTLTGAIDVTQSPQSSFSVSQSILCPGSCVDFYNQTTNGAAFLWNFQGANTDSSIEENPVMVCYTDSGQFDVTLISTNGNCSDTLIFTQYITVYPTPPSVSIQQLGDTLFASTGFSSYEWYLNGNLISGATESFYVCTSNGDYNVIATDSNGCEVEAAIYNVLTKLNLVPFLQQDFIVYPNPAKDVLRIVLPSSFACSQKTTVRIRDIQNRIVYSTTLNNYSLEVNQLNEGMYLIEIDGENEVLRTGFLKSK